MPQAKLCFTVGLECPIEVRILCEQEEDIPFKRAGGPSSKFNKKQLKFLEYWWPNKDSIPKNLKVWFEEYSSVTADLRVIAGKVSKIFPEEPFDFSPTTKINILEKVV